MIEVPWKWKRKPWRQNLKKYKTIKFIGMNYIFGYLFAGLLITMFFEFIFKVIDRENEETKFDSYSERLLFIIMWPFVVYFFVKCMIQK